MKVWRKNIPSRGTSMCKGPETGKSRECLRNFKMVTLWDMGIKGPNGIR